MRLTVTVRDVNGRPLEADVGVVHAERGPGRQVDEVITHLRAGQPLEGELLGHRVGVTVTAADFTVERAVVAEAAGRWGTDNPACTVRVAGDALDVEVTVGCVRFAPTVYLPPGTALSDNPGAAYVEQVGGGAWIYRGGWLNDEKIHRLSEPVFGDPDAVEWQRYHHEPAMPVRLADKGTFVLLEYGFPVGVGRRDPRFLVLVWAPRPPVGTTCPVVVFFSPTTGPPAYPADSHPFLKNYPYAFLPLRPRKPVPVEQTRQPYVDLGFNYIDTGYKIVYQLLAAGRNPVVVMPIQASGSWGPVAAQSGMARLLREVVRFLYARGLVAGRFASPARFSLTGGRAQMVPGEGLLTQERLPEELAVSVSGFSAGINAVVGLCLTEAFDKDTYAPALFGAPAGPFLRQWRELWDVDGVDASGWAHMTAAFQRWAQGRRRLRMYHSQDTYHGQTANGLVEQERITRRSGKAGFVEQGVSRDEHSMWVHFSNSYLIGDVKDPRHQVTIPEFGKLDAHHMVPAIAFGHAALFPPP
ncbi:hypothetical protein C3489_32475 [Streptomyces sp. Ru71]|uniref:hypothetical protein n=1 Tax=Streptomyces sp. Ru71 TaxID=2080746 RepID=UPI000CDCF367|nr:hypothetical protein [Streptomyces sp. Ru71]POX46144.1 hypothetical protein C3489_32475 [Streptomyces sp. Ru71]